MAKRENDSLSVKDLMKSFIKENKLEKGFHKIHIEEAWYKIYNMSGQLILSGNVIGSNPLIKLPQLPAGIYVFQLENTSPELLKVGATKLFFI